MGTEHGRADRTAGWATGIGIGLITLMVTWLVGGRLAGLVWSPPTAAIVPFLTATCAGCAVSVTAGMRLARRGRR